MNYTKAKTNCEDKMSIYGIGRLFEPKSYNMSEMVAAKANEILKNEFFRIGVNDIVQPDNFVYDSNSMPIGFTPNWSQSSSYQNNNDSHKCIVIGIYLVNLGMWYDYTCENPYYSVCE